MSLSKFQCTIKNNVSFVGVGLHSGKNIEVILKPSKENSGICFFKSDKNNTQIKALYTNIFSTQMSTRIGNEDCNVSTIEHFMSALNACGIDNLDIFISGSEMPILDGSSFEFIQLIKPNIKVQNEAKKVAIITKEVQVSDDEKISKISPCENREFKFNIFFEHPKILKQDMDFSLSSIEDYEEKISKARTFGFMKDFEYLKNNSLALGASLDNCLVFDENNIINDGNYSNEPVRHKILDAIGDLYMFGFAIIGKYESSFGSHELNKRLLEEIQKQNAYKIVSL